MDSSGSVRLLSRFRRLHVLPHFVLVPAALVAAFPVILIVLNSLKTTESLFGRPFELPVGSAFSLAGYNTVLRRADFLRYFANSIYVLLFATAFIMATGAMISWALAEYRFIGRGVLSLYMIMGTMISIRLGSVGILRIVVRLGLPDSLWALILVYTASGLPLTVFVLTQFMRQIPGELKDAARVDGASEYQIFFLILPLVRPALATIAIFAIIPVWNDLWFPLILAPSERARTVTLFTQQFLGQYTTDWQAMLAALTLAMVPVLALYAIFSKQLIRGILSGSFK